MSQTLHQTKLRALDAANDATLLKGSWRHLGAEAASAKDIPDEGVGPAKEGYEGSHAR